MKLKHKRVLLKLSGEMFGGDKNEGIDLIRKYPIDLAVVIGTLITE